MSCIILPAKFCSKNFAKWKSVFAQCLAMKYRRNFAHCKLLPKISLQNFAEMDFTAQKFAFCSCLLLNHFEAWTARTCAVNYVALFSWKHFNGNFLSAKIPSFLLFQVKFSDVLSDAIFCLILKTSLSLSNPALMEALHFGCIPVIQLWTFFLKTQHNCKNACHLKRTLEPKLF